MQRAGIPCPRAVKLKNNVLLLEFIGEDGRAAPRLRDVHFDSDDELTNAFEQTLVLMRAMYARCALVHADLSEYNILYHNGRCVIIDVSQVCVHARLRARARTHILQSVDTSHPRALNMLLDDCRNVIDFFGRQRQLESTPSVRTLFNSVTGLTMRSDDTLFDDVSALLPRLHAYTRRTQVDKYALENRSVSARRDKHNPADCELQRAIDDEDDTDDDNDSDNDHENDDDKQ
jgi:serine/threonine-protein kinase RIO1